MTRKAAARRVLFVFGTRPEAIKLAPVILRMREDGRFLPRVCATAQHREMLDQVLETFGIRADHDLNLMRKGQDLFSLTARGLVAVGEVLRRERPDMVIVQGDTTSTFLGGLAAFYLRIPVGHVEAGLRTHDKYNPFPEEINRKLAAQVADLHFAPTAGARDNLVRENVPRKRIFVTGNTGIDALLLVKARLERDGSGEREIRKLLPRAWTGKPVILVTAHRRESFGDDLRAICGAIGEIASRHPEAGIVFPVHPNPNVAVPVKALLKGRENVLLLGPMGYRQFVSLLMRSQFILTDSGGIQEEAPSLGKPVLVMRRATERVEAIRDGAGRLVGTGRRSIVENAEELLASPEAYRKMVPRRNPYGDGKSAERILRAILQLPLATRNLPYIL